MDSPAALSRGLTVSVSVVQSGEVGVGERYVAHREVLREVSEGRGALGAAGCCRLGPRAKRVLPVGVMPIRSAAACTATSLTALGMFGKADPSGTYLAGGRGRARGVRITWTHVEAGPRTPPLGYGR